MLRFAPQPAAGGILLKIHSVSVNRTLDLIVRAGKYPVKIRFILTIEPPRVAWHLASIFIYTDKSSVLNTITITITIANRR